jgi:hypothetical protein
VEDEPLIAELVSPVLSEAGYGIVERERYRVEGLTPGKRDLCTLAPAILPGFLSIHSFLGSKILSYECQSSLETAKRVSRRKHGSSVATG